jgi:hypothetical protein
VSNDSGYYMPVADIRGTIYAYGALAGGVVGFSTAAWARNGTGNFSTLPLISSAGAGLLKDMGKTIVSAARTFRKVQLVTNSASTFGVAGPTSTAPGEDYFTGYIELGFEGNGTPAKVASFGR